MESPKLGSFNHLPYLVPSNWFPFSMEPPKLGSLTTFFPSNWWFPFMGSPTKRKKGRTKKGKKNDGGEKNKKTRKPSFSRRLVPAELLQLPLQLPPAQLLRPSGASWVGAQGKTGKQVNKQQKRGRAVVPPMGLRRQSLILVACIIMAV